MTQKNISFLNTRKGVGSLLQIRLWIWILSNWSNITPFGQSLKKRLAIETLWTSCVRRSIFVSHEVWRISEVSSAYDNSTKRNVVGSLWKRELLFALCMETPSDKTLGFTFQDWYFNFLPDNQCIIKKATFYRQHESIFRKIYATKLVYISWPLPVRSNLAIVAFNKNFSLTTSVFFVPDKSRAIYPNHTLSEDKVSPKKGYIQTFYGHQHKAQNLPNPVVCSIWFCVIAF